jgi:hypothetical protein
MNLRSGLFLMALALTKQVPASTVELLPDGRLAFHVVVTSDVPFRGGEIAFSYDGNLFVLSRIDPGPDLPAGPGVVVAADPSPREVCPEAALAAATVAWIHADNGIVLPAGTHRVLTLVFTEGPELARGGCFAVRFRNCLGTVEAPARNVITTENGGSRVLAARDWHEVIEPAAACGSRPEFVLEPDVEARVDLELTECEPTACLRAVVPPGRPLLIALDDPNDGNVNALRARWGAEASAADFDAAAVDRSADQRLVVDPTREAPLFVRVESPVRRAPGQVTVILRSVDLSVSRITPTIGAEGGRVSAAIRGGGFEPERTTFSLRGSAVSQTISGETTVVASDRAEVLFRLGPAPRGLYHVVAREEDVEMAFTESILVIVAADEANGLGVRLRGNDLYRNRVPSHATLRVANIGIDDRPAPLLKVLAPANVGLRLSRGDAFLGNELLVFGTNPHGFAGRLAGGIASEVPIVFQGENCLSCDVTFQVHLLTPLPVDRVGWTSMPAPPGVGPGAWPALAVALEARLGSTWGAVHESLTDIATRLARRGMEGDSPAEALRFAAREALGRPVAAIVGRVVGASGSPLEDVSVAALEGGSVRSHARTDSRGTFAIDWLEGSSAGSTRTYRLEALDHVGAVDVPMPLSGDVLGVELRVEEGAHPLDLDEPNRDESDLPRAMVFPPTEVFTPVADFRTEIAGPRDPNDKTGPDAEGDEGLIGPGVEAFYTIYFENLPDAGLPVQRVVVVDTLPPGIDWSTVRLRDAYVGGVAGGRLAPLSSAGTDRHTGYSRSPEETLYGVRLEREPQRYTWSGMQWDALYTLDAAVEVSEGRVTWTFQTIDPETLMPPDPGSRLGLLPPNDPGPPRGDGLGQGEGYVSFSAFTREDLDEGEPIINEVSIQFDSEAPLVRRYTNVFSRFPPAHAPRNPVPASTAGEPGDRRVPLNISLCWEPAANARTYDLRLWKDGDPRPETPTVPGLRTTCALPPAPLEPDTVYHWEVTARNIRRQETTGDRWTFRTELPPPQPFFRRGDADVSGSVDLTDAIRILNVLFLGIGEIPCLDAADSDDSGGVNLTDAIRILNVLFLGIGEVPLPGTENCGTDPTDDATGCAGYTARC